MKTILILIFVLIIRPLLGQEPYSSSIYIRATNSVKNSEFKVYIYEREECFKVVYKIRDSISYRAELDSTLSKYRALIFSNKYQNVSNDTSTTLLMQVDSIIQAYSIYSQDSILIERKKNMNFDSLISTIMSSKSGDLVNDSFNKNRLMFDGTIIKFELRDNQQYRIVYAHSPTVKSHPLLGRLIIEIMNIYRMEKHNGFLNTIQTNGY